MSQAEGARLLVDFYFAHPVGHVIEALRYALGYHSADPDRRISLVLNGSSPTELADLVPHVEAVYSVGGCLDFLHGGDARQAIGHIPRDWHYVVDDARRDHPGLRAAFPGMAAYYDASDPFYSVLPDPDRFPCYHQLEPDPPLVADRDGEGPRSPSMCADRIDDDLGELLQAAGLLIERQLSYDQAMAGHFQRLLRFFHGRAPLIWSVDNAHADYVDPSRSHQAS